MSGSGVESVTWNHKAREPSPGTRFLQLEPLRGLAAMNVFVGHFFLGFTPHAHGLLFPDEPGGFIRSPLFAIMNGGSAVMFFFILSGFVLTAKAFEERDARSLGLSALRRWPRLALLTCLVSIAAAVLAILGLYANRHVASLTGSEWLASWRFSFPGRPPSVLDAALEGGFLTFLTGSAYYDSSLWTMYYEFVGSFLAFGLAALLIWFSAPRFVPVLLVLVWGAVFAMSPLLSCFVLGAGLAWAHGEGWIARLAVIFSRPSRFLRLTTALVGVLFIILWGYYLPVGFYGLVGRVSPFNDLGTRVLIQSVAAVLLLIFALIHRPFGRLLTTRAGRLLGRLSFPIYLIHLPILCSFSSALYLFLLPWLSSAKAVALVFPATVLVLLVASLPLAAADARWTARLRGWANMLFPPHPRRPDRNSWPQRIQ